MMHNPFKISETTDLHSTDSQTDADLSKNLEIAESLRSAGTFLDIPIRELTVDRAVQRAYLNKSTITKIVNDPVESAFGTLLVSWRSDDEKHVADGQHRLIAMRELVLLGKLPEDYAHQCEVFYNLTHKQEAQLFVLRNARTAIQSIEAFRIRVEAGDPIAIGAQEIANQYGWKITMGLVPGSLAAAQTLYDAYELNPAATERAIEVITKAWGKATAGMAGQLLMGLVQFLNRYGDTIKTDRLVAKMEPYKPATFLGEARSHKSTVGGTVQHAVADLLTMRYNGHLKNHTLPDWRTGKK